MKTVLCSVVPAEVSRELQRPDLLSNQVVTTLHDITCPVADAFIQSDLQ